MAALAGGMWMRWAMIERVVERLEGRVDERVFGRDGGSSVWRGGGGGGGGVLLATLAAVE